MYWNSLRREHHLKNECVFGSMCWRGLPVYDRRRRVFLPFFYWIQLSSSRRYDVGRRCFFEIYIHVSFELIIVPLLRSLAPFAPFAPFTRSTHTPSGPISKTKTERIMCIYVDLVWVLAFIWPRLRCSVALVFSSGTHKNHQYHRMHPIHGQGLLRAFQMIEALNLFFFRLLVWRETSCTGQNPSSFHLPPGAFF